MSEDVQLTRGAFVNEIILKKNTLKHWMRLMNVFLTIHFFISTNYNSVYLEKLGLRDLSASILSYSPTPLMYKTQGECLCNHDFFYGNLKK